VVDQVGVAVRFDDHQAAGDVGIADEVGEGRVGRPEAIAAEDHQRVQATLAHQAGEVGLHSWSVFGNALNLLREGNLVHLAYRCSK